MIVYISIGNSDDKLTQSEWAFFCRDVDIIIRSRRLQVHGQWFSAPDSKYQNACWCVEHEFGPAGREDFKDQLRTIARQYKQDSIAWAEVERTEFI